MAGKEPASDVRDRDAIHAWASDLAGNLEHLSDLRAEDEESDAE